MCCRYPYKGGEHAQRLGHRASAAAQFAACSNHVELAKKLAKACHYNGVIVFYVLQWYEKRKTQLGDLVKVFGAPFEAEAQCVYLEKVGLADGILSSDSDMCVHGAQRLYSGYNTRSKSTSKKAYVQKDHPVLGSMTLSERAAFATVCGCDYIKGLKKVGWVKGRSIVLIRSTC